MTRPKPTPEQVSSKKAYSYTSLGQLVELSRRELYNRVQAGELIPTYPTGSEKTPRFTEAEVNRWIKSWPAEPTKKQD